MGIRSFKDSDVEAFFKKGTRVRRKGWDLVRDVVGRKLDMLHYAKEIKDLRSPPNNRLEKLKGNLDGLYSIRINDQWRIVFGWDQEPYDVRIVDYHQKRNIMNRKPTFPGEILLQEFLVPLELTQKELADHLQCDYKVINRIINGKASVSPEMAMKLAAAFNTTPSFWLNAQIAMDLWRLRTQKPKIRSLIRRRRKINA